MRILENRTLYPAHARCCRRAGRAALPADREHLPRLGAAVVEGAAERRRLECDAVRRREARAAHDQMDSLLRHEVYALCRGEPQCHQAVPVPRQR